MPQYNKPMKLRYVASYSGDKRDDGPRVKKSQDWQVVTNGMGRSVQRPPQKISRKKKNDFIRSQAVPRTVVSGQDTALLGTTSGKAGGHGGFGL